MSDPSPNWARFGLSTPTPDAVAGMEATVDDTTDATTSTEATEATRLRNPLLEEGFYGGQEEELFSDEKPNPAIFLCDRQRHAPWWLTRQFFVRERLLFGRWDGVFTSCLVNLLGVIVFLRSGWVVGQAGVAMAAVIVLMAVLVVLTSVLSAVGIYERSVCRNGVEGGSSGGVYFLLAHVLGGQIGGAVGLVYCFGQTVSITLCVAGFGESVGDLVSLPHPWLQRGVAAGALLLLALVNVAGVKWVVKVQFLLLLVVLLAVLDFLLGSLLPVHAGDPAFSGWSMSNLRNNTDPAYTAGHSWFTVAGVFFPSVTGIMAGINMSGDLREPVADIPVGTLAALGFSTCVYLTVMLVLAATVRRDVLLTDFMITEKVSAVGVLLVAGLYTASLSSSLASLYGTPRVLQSIAGENVVPLLGGLAKGRGPNQVPMRGVTVVVLAAAACLLIGNITALAPVVTTPFLLTYAAVDYAYFALAVTADTKACKERQDRRPSVMSGATPYRPTTATAAGGVLDRLFPERITQHRKIITSAASSDSSSLATTPDDASRRGVDDHLAEASAASALHFDFGIADKPQHWYSRMCNRYVALTGALLKVALMMAVNWPYGLATVGASVLVYLYIGQAAPGLPPGLAGDFSLWGWIKWKFLTCLGRAPVGQDLLVVAPLHPGVEVEARQLTEDNRDFAARSRYHASSAGNTMPSPPTP